VSIIGHNKVTTYFEKIQIRESISDFGKAPIMKNNQKSNISGALPKSEKAKN